MEQFEVGEDRFRSIMEALLYTSRALARHHRKKERPWVNLHYFLSGALVPCRYDPMTRIPCLETGKLLDFTLPLPEDFNWLLPSKAILGLNHFSPRGCPNLTTEDSVLCLCSLVVLGRVKYHFTRHKVGRCPFKRPYTGNRRINRL